MTSPHPRRRLTRNVVFGLASALVGATLYAPAALGQEDDASCSIPDAGLQERSESDALALASACDAEVLIRDAQDYTSRSFAQPDGSVMSEFSAVPNWVPDATGEWVDADASVEAGADGSLRAAATVSELQFGGEGDTAFVTATNPSGERVSLTWTAPLPEPVVEGATVTYPEVLPDVDLEVYSGVADFSYALVVKTPEAAAHPDLEALELGLDVEGLTVAHDAEADTAVLTDDSGEVAYGVARPRMWDAAAEEAAATGEEAGQAAPMPLEIDGDSLTVVPDQDLLADPATEYPVYIDPQFSDESASVEEVFSRETGIACGTSDELCAGAQIWEPDAALGYWRTAIKFDGIGSLANRDIQQVNVWITQVHTGDAGGPNQTVRLYAMNYLDTAGTVSWNTYTNAIVSLVATDSVPTSNTGAGEADQRITWADARTATRVQKLVDDGGNTATFGIISGANADQEADRGRFRKVSASSAKMTVWHAPLKPTSLTIIDENDQPVACSTSAPGPVIDTLTPKLRGKAPGSMRSDNSVSFFLYDRYETHPDAKQTMTFNDVANGATLTGTVSSGKLERGKTYRWNARAWDSDPDSSRYGDLTHYCYFTVNSVPNTPTGLSTESAGCGTQAAPTVVTTRTPKLSAVPSDPDGGTVWARYRFYAQTGDHVLEWKSPKAVSGTAMPWRIPAGTVAADGLYRWRVITDDAFRSSDAWSGYCWIRVDTTAPEPPDVVQMTGSPLPGTTVDFEFVGGSDVRSFRYSLDGGAYQYAAASGGRAEVPITLPATGSIDHSLQVWARDFPIDGAGNTGSATTHLFTAIEAQPAQALGAWRFDGDLLDDAGDQALTTVDAAGTALTGADRLGRADSAAVFDGTASTCLRADGPVADTSRSFTLGGWVLADAAPAAEAAVLDITGETSSNMKLLLTASGRWGVAMTDADGATSTVAVFAPAEATEFGTWTHVAAVYDAAAVRLRLYVNGELMGSKASPVAWSAAGVFSAGCGVKAAGDMFSPFTGAVDDAAVFQQPLTDEQIGELMSGEAMPTALQAWYPLREDDDPAAVPGADYSGRAADLTGMPAAPSWVPDQHGREAGALDLDGATCPTAATAPVRTDAAFSLAAWVRLDADHANLHPRVFSFDGDAVFAVMAKYNATGDRWDLAVTKEDSAATSWGEGAMAVGATETEWTQIGVTVDPVQSEVRLYVNGEFADSGSIAADWRTWRADRFVIGCGTTADGASSEWDGAIADVRVWRGVLDPADFAAVRTERLASWELGEATTGTDEWGSNDLAVAGTLGTDYSWEVDRWNECYAAYGLALGGASWAETAGPVVATDESFTVAAWARVDDLDDYRTIASQGGDQYGAFNLSYNPVLGRFQLSMPQEDSATTKWTRALAVDAPEAGRWYHLTGQVDLGAGVVRLYVDGVLQSEGPIVDSPWQADGAFTIGAAEQLGAMTNHFVGGIDRVQVWGGALDPLAIADLAADRPPYELDPDDAFCEGAEEPPVDP